MHPAPMGWRADSIGSFGMHQPQALRTLIVGPDTASPDLYSAALPAHQPE